MLLFAWFSPAFFSLDDKKEDRWCAVVLFEFALFEGLIGLITIIYTLLSGKTSA